MSNRLPLDIKERLRVAERNLQNAVRELKDAERRVKDCINAAKLLRGLNQPSSTKPAPPINSKPFSIMHANFRDQRHRRNYAHLFLN